MCVVWFWTVWRQGINGCFTLRMTEGLRTKRWARTVWPSSHMPMGILTGSIILYLTCHNTALESVVHLQHRSKVPFVVVLSSAIKRVSCTGNGKFVTCAAKTLGSQHITSHFFHSIPLFGMKEDHVWIGNVQCRMGARVYACFKWGTLLTGHRRVHMHSDDDWMSYQGTNQNDLIELPQQWTLKPLMQGTMLWGSFLSCFVWIIFNALECLFMGWMVSLNYGGITDPGLANHSILENPSKSLIRVWLIAIKMTGWKVGTVWACYIVAALPQDCIMNSWFLSNCLLMLHIFSFTTLVIGTEGDIVVSENSNCFWDVFICLYCLQNTFQPALFLALQDLGEAAYPSDINGGFCWNFVPLKECQMKCKIVNGVYAVCKKSSDQTAFHVPGTPEDFFSDLHNILKVLALGPVKTFCYQRLMLLEQKFNLHVMMNADREYLAQKSAPHRDFYNVRKVRIVKRQLTSGSSCFGNLRPVTPHIHNLLSGFSCFQHCRRAQAKILRMSDWAAPCRVGSGMQMPMFLVINTYPT